LLQSLFRIRLRLTSGQRFLEAWTDSIKVVAKLDSIRKKQAEREGVSLPARKNKRARADELLESLDAIREEQRMQREVLEALLRKCNQPQTDVTQLFSPSSSPLRSPSSLTSVDNAFIQLLDAYSQTDPNERPKKMRRLMKTVPCEYVTMAQELARDLSIPSSTCCEKQEESVSEDEPGVKELYISSVLPLLEETQSSTEADMTDIQQLEHWSAALQDFLVNDA